MSTKKYIVYTHTVKGQDAPFYIGAASSIKRAYNFYSRSLDWHEIYLQCNKEIEVAIFNVNTRDEANQLEQELITKYKGRLCNKIRSSKLPTIELLTSDLLRIAINLGATIRMLRFRQDMTPRDLAKASGINYGLIHRMEKGDSTISLAAYINVLHALGVVEQLGNVGLPETRNLPLPKVTKYQGLSKKEYLKDKKLNISRLANT